MTRRSTKTILGAWALMLMLLSVYALQYVHAAQIEIQAESGDTQHDADNCAICQFALAPAEEASEPQTAAILQGTTVVWTEKTTEAPAAPKTEKPARGPPANV